MTITINNIKDAYNFAEARLAVKSELLPKVAQVASEASPEELKSSVLNVINNEKSKYQFTANGQQYNVLDYPAYNLSLVEGDSDYCQSSVNLQLNPLDIAALLEHAQPQGLMHYLTSASNESTADLEQLVQNGKSCAGETEGVKDEL